MTQLPEPNFIERDPDIITKEWITAYEEKSGKVLQPAQIERLMIDVGAYRETVLRMKIQETAKQNLLSYAPLDILEHIGEPLGVTKLLANSSTTTLKFSLDEPLDFTCSIQKGCEVETKDGIFIFQTGIAVRRASPEAVRGRQDVSFRRSATPGGRSIRRRTPVLCVLWEASCFALIHFE